jgi:hypothetical protein
MSQESTPEGEEAGRTLARNSTADLVVAVLVAVVGAVVVYEARRLGAGWESDGPGSGYFPFYIGALLLGCSAAIFVQAWRARPSDRSTFVDSVQLERVLSVLLPSVVYVGVVMLLGLYVASALFIAAFMVLLGRYPVLKSVAVGVGVNALFFVMFEIWFKVPLFKGALKPLDFLGY